MFRIAATSAVFAFAASLAGPAFATVQEPAANQPPDAPTELSMIGVGDRGCGGVVPGLPDISARVSDPDGGTLSAHFRVERLNGSTWAEVGTRVVHAASGSVARTFIDATWAQTPEGAWINTKYRWTVGAVEAEGEQLAGPRSAPCEFVLDTVDPQLTVVKPTATVPGGKTVPLPDDGELLWLQRGTLLTMKLDPAGSVGYGGVNDVDRYEWNLGFGAMRGSANPSQLGSTYLLKIDTTDISRTGPLPLLIKAFDRSGRFTERELEVYLAGPAQEAEYAFDEGLAATRARDGYDDGSPASTFLLQGGASRSINVPDEDFNLHLNGVDATAVSGTPVVRPALSSPHRAFSVGAWVRPGRIAGHRVLVSQRTSTGMVYAVGIDRCASGVWGCPFFTLRNPDTRASYTARAATPVRLNEWVYLAGSYNDFTPRGRRIQASATYPGGTTKPGRTWLPSAFSLPRMSAGHTRVGAELVGARLSRFFAGHVEELRFFHGELGTDDIRFQMFSVPEGPLAPE